MTTIDSLKKQQKQKVKLHISVAGWASMCEMAGGHLANKSGPGPHPTAWKS